MSIMPGQKAKALYITILLILISLAGFFISQYQAFINPFFINEDIRADYYMHRFHNPALFRNDYFADFFSLFTKSLSCGYYFLYFFLTNFMDVVNAHNIISLLLFLLSLLYLFKLGSFIKDRWVGFFMVIFFIFYFWLTADYSGGTRNVFGETILIIFLYYSCTRNTLGLVSSAIFMFLFYPPLLPIIFLSVVLTDIKISGSQGKPFIAKKIIFIFLVIMIFSYLLLNYQYLTKILPLYGENFSHNELIKMPICGSKGRGSELFPFPSLIDKIKRYLFQYNYMTILFLFLFAFLRKKLLNIPKAIYMFIISGLIMYQIAVVVAFKLHRPSTYLNYTVPIFLISICSFGCGVLFDKANNLKIRYFLVSIFLLISVIINYNKLDNGLTLYKDKGLYQFISKLPNDSVFAAHPVLMDDIAFFGKRNIFLSKEFMWAVAKKYYAENARRTDTFFSIYYNDSPPFIYKTCKKNGIDFIIVDTAHFQNDYLNRGDFYFSPFNSYVQEVVKHKDSFVLNNIPERLKIFSEGGQFIIKTDDLLSLGIMNNGDIQLSGPKLIQ